MIAEKETSSPASEPNFRTEAPEIYSNGASQSMLVRRDRQADFNSNDSLPIHAVEAERGVLGCILQNPEKLKEARAARITRRSFYETRHQDIYSVMLKLEDDGQGFDALSLQLRLRECDLLEKIGGAEYLATLERSTPSAENLPYYLPLLKDAQNRRTVQEFGARLGASAGNMAIDSDALIDDAEQVLRSAREIVGSSRLPAIVDAFEMLATPTEPPAELVHGLLHKGSKLVLGGGSKTFKTWTLLDLALSVSHGEPWLSMKTAKGRVLYLNLEIQPWAFQQRIRSISLAKNIRIIPGQLDCWNLRGHAADFSILLPMIIERVKSEGHSLIVLDPIYKLYGNKMDENAAGDVARLLNGIDGLAVSTGAGVAFGAHFSEGNQAAKESIDRISGSGVFARDPDSILVMTRHEEDDAFVVDSTLRNFKPIEPFVIRWHFPTMHRDDKLDPTKLRQVKPGRPKKYNEDTILKVLGKQKLTSSEWQKKAYSIGVGRTTFFELLKSVQDSKRVTQSTKNEKWSLSKTPSPESPETT